MTMVQNFQCLLLKCVHIFRFLLEHIFTIFISECVSICKQAHFDFIFFSKYSDSNEVKGTDSSLGCMQKTLICGHDNDYMATLAGTHGT